MRFRPASQGSVKSAANQNIDPVNKLNCKNVFVGWKAFLILVVLSLTVQRGLAVTLTWNQNPDPTTAGYRLYYGVDTLTYTNAIDFANVRTNVVSGLVQDVTYYFAVTAYDASGLESDFSSELSYTVTPAGNTPPTISVIGDQTIFLNTSVLAAPFTIGDFETPVASLTLSGS